MQALLELDCMPAGMELSPAASEEQWQWITRVIDESDYYIVLIGGKYGSINTTSGQSYTEMEYRYALESGKPCIGFIIDKSIDLPASKVEADLDRRNRLKAFKDLVQTRLCKFWLGSADLGAKVSTSITQLIKRVPATGWIKADQAARTNNEAVLTLRNRVLELERELDAARWSGKPGLADLAQGDDPYELIFRIFTEQPPQHRQGIPVFERTLNAETRVKTTWNEIASVIGFVVLDDGDYHRINHFMVDYFATVISEQAGLTVSGWELAQETVTQIKIQLSSLGYIDVQIDETPTMYGSGPGEYGQTFALRRERWIPTPEGKLYFGRQTAIKRSNDHPKRLATDDPT